MTVCTGVATDNRVQWPVFVYDSVYMWGGGGEQTTEFNGLRLCMTVCTGVATDNRVQWPVVVYDSVYRWGGGGGSRQQSSMA